MPRAPPPLPLPSMLAGLSYAFTGNYNEYFGMNTDVDAVVYLMLVNNMIHDMFPTAITVGA